MGIAKELQLQYVKRFIRRAPCSLTSRSTIQWRAAVSASEASDDAWRHARWWQPPRVRQANERQAYKLHSLPTIHRNKLVAFSVAAILACQALGDTSDVWQVSAPAGNRCQYRTDDELTRDWKTLYSTCPGAGRTLQCSYAGEPVPTPLTRAGYEHSCGLQNQKREIVRRQ